MGVILAIATLYKLYPSTKHTIKKSNTALRHTSRLVACPTRFAFSHTLVRYALLILKRYQHQRSHKLAINSNIDPASICSSTRSTKQNPSSSTHRQLRQHTVYQHRHRHLHDIDFDLIDFDIHLSLSTNRSLVGLFGHRIHGTRIIVPFGFSPSTSIVDIVISHGIARQL